MLHALKSWDAFVFKTARDAAIKHEEAIAKLFGHDAKAAAAVASGGEKRDEGKVDKRPRVKVRVQKQAETACHENPSLGLCLRAYDVKLFSGRSATKNDCIYEYVVTLQPPLVLSTPVAAPPSLCTPR